MTSCRLIQIVPFRTLAPEGVGDYARIIAERLRAQSGIVTSFISGTPLPPEERRDDEWETIELAERKSAALYDAIEALRSRHGDAPILLHLSGYGYHHKGVPLWVATALERWRVAHPAGRLMTVFHELYAKGPVWSSAFWLGWAQIWGVRRIYRASDAGLVTTSQNLELLRRWERGGPPLAHSPCFATIGEPGGPIPPASQRPPRLVVFGRYVHKRIYGDHHALIADFVRAQGIEEIVDIGARTAPPPPEIGGAPLRALGELAPEPLIRELCQARFGLLVHEADRVAKSSIFGALCASGVIPVCINGEEGRRDGLEPGVHYIKLDPAQPPPASLRDRLDELQAGATGWYEPHSIAATVDIIHGRLFAGSSSVKA